MFQVLGTVCKMLPWHHYELVLRYYLGKLRQTVEFQKQLVRVVVEILNAFHFDLSNADIKCTKVIYENKTNMDGSKSDAKTDNIIVNDNGSYVDVKAETNKGLEDILKENEIVEEDQSEVIEIMDVVEIPVLERNVVLSKSLATRVVFIIKTILLPQLYKTISIRTQSDMLHKINRKMAGPDRDEEDILRVPVALAAIKLLQNLPEEVLHQNIGG